MPDDGFPQKLKHVAVTTISGFHCDVHEICALLGCYAASSGKGLPLNAM
jgi:hypothetical protein